MPIKPDNFIIMTGKFIFCLKRVSSKKFNMPGPTSKIRTSLNLANKRLRNVPEMRIGRNIIGMN